MPIFTLSDSVRVFVSSTGRGPMLAHTGIFFESGFDINVPRVVIRSYDHRDFTALEVTHLLKDGKVVRGPFIGRVKKVQQGQPLPLLDFPIL